MRRRRLLGLGAAWAASVVSLRSPYDALAVPTIAAYVCGLWPIGSGMKSL